MASIKSTEGALAAAFSKIWRIRSSDSPDVPPTSSGPDAFSMEDIRVECKVKSVIICKAFCTFKILAVVTHNKYLVEW